jgi:hypothetical protein
MRKYTTWCLLAVMCTAVGCKTFTQKVSWETSGIVLPHYALRLPAKSNVAKTLHRPEPETRDPDISGGPLVIREKPAEPLGLPEKTEVSGDCGISAAVAATRSAPKAAVQPPPQKVASPTPVPKTTSQATTVEKREPQPALAVEAPLETESPLQPMWNRIWYAIAPLVSALGAYVLAPLFVDFLKQRLSQARRGSQGKKETAGV